MYEARNTKNRHNCLVLFEHRNGTEFIIFDTETTGVDPSKDYIIEFSAKKYRVQDSDISLIDEMDEFIRPPVRMGEKVISIHGISNEFLIDKPTENEVFQRIHEFLGPRPILVGYNVPFDIGMLKSMYLRSGLALNPMASLDVMEMARDIVVPGECENYKLGTITDLFGLSEGLSFHRAIDDVEATARLLRCFYAEYRQQQENTGQKEKLYLNNAHFWKGRNKQQSGVWCNTSHGQVYYSTFLKRWRSSEVNLPIMDINDFENQVLSRYAITASELSTMTERRWEEYQNRKYLKGGSI